MSNYKPEVFLTPFRLLTPMQHLIFLQHTVTIVTTHLPARLF